MNKPRIKLMMAGKIVTAAIDTGSNYSILTSKGLDSLDLDVVNLRKTHLSLTSATNNRIHIRGKIDLPIQFGELSKGVKFSFFVVENIDLKEECLVGMDFFTNFSCSMEFCIEGIIHRKYIG